MEGDEEDGNENNFNNQSLCRTDGILPVQRLPILQMTRKSPAPRCGAPKRSTGGADGLGVIGARLAPVSFPKLGLNSAPSHIFPPFPSTPQLQALPKNEFLNPRFVQQNSTTKSASHPREMPPEAVEARPLHLW